VARPKRRPGHKRIANWERLLRRAHLSAVKSDDPDRPLTESPQTWLLHASRVTYLQWFAHREGLPPRVRAVSRAFERYLDKVRWSSSGARDALDRQTPQFASAD
jgi:hypothetical protein